MSRVGFKPVALPEGVTVVQDGNVVTVKGPKGELNVKIGTGVSVKVGDGHVTSTPAGTLQQDAENHGTAMANIHNAIVGVSEGWKKELEISGIGYRAAMKGNDIVMNVGYSHSITISPVGEKAKISLKDETHIIVEGINRQEVGQTAALIRDTKRPEPYGGKGVMYKGEVIVRKVGKRAAATGAKK